MKRIIISVLLLIQTMLVFAQNGTIKGNVTDAKTNEPLIGTTVLIKGTTQGTITDFDGNYTIPNVAPGSHILAISFISYDTQEIPIEVKSGQETLVNVKLKQATLEIEGVEVVAKANRESESMLLLDQKNATGIKESIGAQALSNQGVSDAASATSKIAGVTKNESSGDVYIRGLGDRYLTTTMNGLPIPSDDVEKKNIDLNLFSTDIIKNVGINKTFSVETYGDQSSGNVNIASKSFSDKMELELSSGIGTNIMSDGIWSGFRTTHNMNDVSFGFFSSDFTTKDAIQNQSWNTLDRNLPMGLGFAFAGGKNFKVFNKNLSVFATISHDNSYEYQKGIYQKYRSNVLDNSFSDATTFGTSINTTGLLNLAYDINKNHNININSLFVGKTKDELYEQGRNGEGYVFDQDPQEDGAFVRDQNLKETQMIITQVLGTHHVNERNLMEWAAGYNYVNSEEPNRIRNEVNILSPTLVQFAHVGDYQQRKSLQNIDDSELNGYLRDAFSLIDEDEKKIKLNFGANIRMKKRDFNSLFTGVRAKGFQVASIDNLDEAFLNRENFYTSQLILKTRLPDLYNASLKAYAAYTNIDFARNKFSGNVGLRYEYDNIDVNWDVANYVGRKGSLSNDYNNLLPALSLRYAFSDKSFLRFAASKTITLPEFKELSPFEYVSPTGRVTKGNPDLKNSNNYNFDIKWEIFPASKELISVTGFYKMINDPINLAQTRGSSGNFIYENTGEKADVFGFEVETRMGVVKSEGSNSPGLDVIFNATKMWFSQDLLEEFQYNNKTESGLQGASEFIANATLSFSDFKEKEFRAAVTANYSSDKILALGAPEDLVYNATLFNNEIIEKGFTTIDIIVSKKFTERIAIKLTGKNLLNPKIEQTQEIKPLSGEGFTAVVNSYKKGINLNLGVKINLNK